MNCNILEDCACFPAETKANCKCKQLNITEWFTSLQHRLPVVTPSVSFRRNKEGSVQANIHTMATSEMILTVQDKLDTEIMVDNAVCTVSNAVLHGCYNCAKGALAKVTCTSSKSTQAEIRCKENSFAIKCDEKGTESTLYFSFIKARVHIVCTVSCGNLQSTFEVGGILKFTHSAQAMVNMWLDGRTNNLSEVQWPDIYHIVNVFMQWYKTTLITLIVLLILVGATYICISTCGLSLVWYAFRIVLRTLLQFFRICFRVPFLLSKQVIRKVHEKLL